MEFSVALQNTQSLREVIDLINSGGTNRFEPDAIAAQYAYKAAGEAGNGITADNLQQHLTNLTENGAVFNIKKALSLATN